MTRKLPMILLIALSVGGLAWNAITSYFSSTEVTVEVVLHPSGEVITEVARITSYETYFPEPGEDIEGYQQYGPIFPVDTRPNVFTVDTGVQAGFEVTVGTTELGPIGTQGGGAEERTLTFSSRHGLVRLNVETDGAAEVFIQATSDPASGTFESQSQGLPEDGQMVFLLPEGDWTFAVHEDGLRQTTVVSVPRGDVVEATLNLRSRN